LLSIGFREVEKKEKYTNFVCQKRTLKVGGVTTFTHSEKRQKDVRITCAYIAEHARNEKSKLFFLDAVGACAFADS
jgi:hypothetical protein